MIFPLIKLQFIFKVTNCELFLAVDLAYGNVLCFQCGDYVYDSELSDVARGSDIQAATSLDVSAVYTPWTPSPIELQLLQANPCVRAMVKDSTIGQARHSSVNHIRDIYENVKRTTLEVFKNENSFNTFQTIKLTTV